MVVVVVVGAAVVVVVVVVVTEAAVVVLVVVVVVDVVVVVELDEAEGQVLGQNPYFPSTKLPPASTSVLHQALLWSTVAHSFKRR